MKVLTIISKLTALGVLLDIIAISAFSAIAGNTHARPAPAKGAHLQPPHTAGSKSALTPPQ